MNQGLEVKNKLSELTPLQFQKEVIQEIDDFNGRDLCALPMGLGKTLITLWWLEKHPEAFPVLIVCPVGLKYMWQHEVQHVLGLDSYVLEGKTPNYIGDLGYQSIVIANYDILSQPTPKKTKKNPNPKSKPSWLPPLISVGFKTLVLEESHACKDPKSKRTQACKKLSRGIPNLLALSGTPLTNRPIELFPVLNMLLPATFSSAWGFGMKYCGGRRGPWGWEFKGATKTQELNVLLKSTCMSRRIKSEVLKDLPDKNRCILPVPIRNPEDYEEATENFIMWLAKQDPIKAKNALRAETLVQLGYLKRLAAKLKAKYVIRWINQWLEENGNEKIVLFAEHKPMVRLLKERVKATSVVIEGSTPKPLRFEYEQCFQKDKNLRVIILNRRAGGIGLNLTAASTLAFTEMDWVPGNMTQAEDRIHRIGQENKAWIYYFVGIGTIEEKLCKVLQSKQKVLDAVLDGVKMSGEGSMGIHDQLMGEYNKKAKGINNA